MNSGKQQVSENPLLPHTVAKMYTPMIEREPTLQRENKHDRKQTGLERSDLLQLLLMSPMVSTQAAFPVSHACGK